MTDQDTLTLDKMLVAAARLKALVSEAPPQLLVTPHIPPKITGSRRKPIMAHPLVRPLCRLLGLDEQVCWGPWKPIERPGDPVKITWQGRSTIYLSPAHYDALRRSIDKT